MIWIRSWSDADDCNIYVQAERSGARLLASITVYLENKLKLNFNDLKSAVDRSSRQVFRGYSFTGGKASRIRVSKQSVQKLKAKLRKTFREGRGHNLKRTIGEILNPIFGAARTISA